MCVRPWCALLCCLLAVGCAESQVQTAAEQEAGDDIKCQSGGAKPTWNAGHKPNRLEPNLK